MGPPNASNFNVGLPQSLLLTGILGCLFCPKDGGGFRSAEHIFAESLRNKEHAPQLALSVISATTITEQVLSSPY